MVSGIGSPKVRPLLSIPSVSPFPSVFSLPLLPPWSVCLYVCPFCLALLSSSSASICILPPSCLSSYLVAPTRVLCLPFLSPSLVFLSCLSGLSNSLDSLACLPLPVCQTNAKPKTTPTRRSIRHAQRPAGRWNTRSIDGGDGMLWVVLLHGGTL
jgi:hypothetical protein